MRKLKTLAERFEEFAKALRIKPQDMEVMRLTWYAGYATCHDTAINEVAALPDDQAEIEMQGITDELNAFTMAHLMKARKGTVQ